LGDEGLLNVIKELLPALYQPLVEIYSNSDIPGLLTAFFKTSKISIDLMKNPNDEDKTKLDNLSKAAESFEEAVFIFVKKIIKEDKGDIEAILSWSSSFFMNTHNVIIDIQGLFAELNPEQQEFVLKEINDWMEFKNLERKAKETAEELKVKPPTQSHIPKLLVIPFLAAVAPSLQSIRITKT